MKANLWAPVNQLVATVDVPDDPVPEVIVWQGRVFALPKSFWSISVDALAAGNGYGEVPAAFV
jgi:hypothetical protein